MIKLVCPIDFKVSKDYSSMAVIFYIARQIYNHYQIVGMSRLNIIKLCFTFACQKLQHNNLLSFSFMNIFILVLLSFPSQLAKVRRQGQDVKIGEVPQIGLIQRKNSKTSKFLSISNTVNSVQRSWIQKFWVKGRIQSCRFFRFFTYTDDGLFLGYFFYGNRQTYEQNIFRKDVQ